MDELVWGKGGEGTGSHLQGSSKTRSLFLGSWLVFSVCYIMGSTQKWDWGLIKSGKSAPHEIQDC